VDRASRAISLEVRQQPGVHYRIEFVGTLATDVGALPRVTAGNPSQGKTKITSLANCSPAIGQILACFDGPKVSYRFTGKELYVRAVVRSDLPVDRPTNEGPQKQNAWCQPVTEKSWQGR
jgi:hypothetical protein